MASLRDEMIVAWLLEHKVHVTWSHRMTSQLLQQLADRPVVGNRVRHGYNTPEPKHSVFIALHDASPVGAISFRMLHVVHARAVRLPDVDLDSFDRLSLHVFKGAEHEEGLAIRVMCHQVAVRHIFCFMGMERAEDGAFSGVGGFWVVDRVDKERESEDIGEENEFLGLF